MRLTLRHIVYMFALMVALTSMHAQQGGSNYSLYGIGDIRQSIGGFYDGLGGTQFGLNPMPGITSFRIRTENRGSLKTATINIRANNREQFDIIDIL